MGGHPKLAVAVGPHDHVLGDPGAPLTLVQYGDYTCPYTRRASPTWPSPVASSGSASATSSVTFPARI